MIMGRIAGFLLVMSFLFMANAKPIKVFNVMNYNAVSDGRTDSSQAFLKAWNDACQWDGKAHVFIPKGVYVLDSVVFLGECKGPIAFYMKGTLKPPSNLKDREQWITFRYVDQLTVSGGGTFDGKGYNVWDCDKNPNCHTRPVSLRLEFITNGRVHHIRSVNSQNAHISLFGCSKMKFYKVRLTAPGDSPNTDGIKIGGSKEVEIYNSKIETGDDCVAIISGSRNVSVSNLHCGPGHGISVGSMGRYADEEDTVVGVSVKDCTLDGTTDGLRIKTWSSPNAGLASNIFYKNVRMVGVRRPIIIDQQYCPDPPCDMSTPSHVQIKDITFDNIWGSSSEKVAVTLNCSRKYPCKNIVLKDINLHQAEGGGSTTAVCDNAVGNSYGRQKPPSCF